MLRYSIGDISFCGLINLIIPVFCAPQSLISYLYLLGAYRNVFFKYLRSAEVHKPSLFRQNCSESMLDLIHTSMLLLTIQQLSLSPVIPCSHWHHSHREPSMPPPVGHYNASKMISPHLRSRAQLEDWTQSVLLK